MFWNAPPIARRKRRPNEPLWTMTLAGRGSWSAELRGHGEWGWELQILRDGGFHYGHCHQLRAQATAEADHWRRELEAKGWTLL